MYRVGDSPASRTNPGLLKPLSVAVSPVSVPPVVLVTLTWRYIAPGPDPHGLLLSTGAIGVIAEMLTAPAGSAAVTGTSKAACRAMKRASTAARARSRQRT